MVRGKTACIGQPFDNTDCKFNPCSSFVCTHGERYDSDTGSTTELMFLLQQVKSR